MSVFLIDYKNVHDKGLKGIKIVMWVIWFIYFILKVKKNYRLNC